MVEQRGQAVGACQSRATPFTIWWCSRQRLKAAMAAAPRHAATTPPVDGPQRRQKSPRFAFIIVAAHAPYAGRQHD